MMGSPKDEKGRFSDEGPWKVRVSQPFALGRYAVTFAEYDRFCEERGRKKPTDCGWGRAQQPVVSVGWEDAIAYCAWLSERTRRFYRLPSEAEWEHACRAGTATRYSWGNEVRGDLANFNGRLGRTAKVGMYPPNGWGLHEMHGNVWEWCVKINDIKSEVVPSDASAWHEALRSKWYYPSIRGGSWRSNPEYYLRSAYRGSSESNSRDHDIGFRVFRALAFEGWMQSFSRLFRR